MLSKKNWWRVNAIRVARDTKKLENREDAHREFLRMRNEESKHDVRLKQIEDKAPLERNAQEVREIEVEKHLKDKASHSVFSANLALERTHVLAKVPIHENQAAKAARLRELTVEEFNYVVAVREVRGQRVKAMAMRTGMYRTKSFSDRMSAVTSALHSAARRRRDPPRRTKAANIDAMLESRIRTFSYYTREKPQFAVARFVGALRSRARKTAEVGGGAVVAAGSGRRAAARIAPRNHGG